MLLLKTVWHVTELLFN